MVVGVIIAIVAGLFGVPWPAAVLLGIGYAVVALLFTPKQAHDPGYQYRPMLDALRADAARTAAQEDAQRVDAAVRSLVSQHVAMMAPPCPTCGAEPEALCRDPSGAPIVVPHAARVAVSRRIGNPLLVVCPTCHADAKVPCVDDSRAAISQPHSARVRASERADDLAARWDVEGPPADEVEADKRMADLMSAVLGREFKPPTRD